MVMGTKEEIANWASIFINWNYASLIYCGKQLPDMFFLQMFTDFTTISLLKKVTVWKVITI